MHELIAPFDAKKDISKYFRRTLHQLRERQTWQQAFLGLLKEPTKDELRSIFDNYDLETGLAHIKDTGNWGLIKGVTFDGLAIPTDIENLADIIAHTHADKGFVNDLPSPDDAFAAVDSEKKYFIVHTKGITYHTGIKEKSKTEKRWLPKISEDLTKLQWVFLREEFVSPSPKKCRQAYRDFLKKMGVVVIQKKWQELPDKNPLSGFKV